MPPPAYRKFSAGLTAVSVSRLLYRRAARLRRVTGDRRYKSQGEIEAEHMTVNELAMMNLVRPFILMFVEPIVAFWNVYIALVYGILYIFIESFRVVFVEHHGFNLGQNGLSFLVRFPASCMLSLELTVTRTGPLLRRAPHIRVLRAIRIAGAEAQICRR